MKWAVVFCAVLLAIVAAAKGYVFNPDDPPGFLAIGPDGTFYAATGYWEEVHKVSPAGKILGIFTSKRDGIPSDAVFDKSGDMYAVEWDTIVKFSPRGWKMLAFSPAPTWDGSDGAYPEAKRPFGLAIDSKGVIYVSYMEAKVIDRFDASGKYLGAFVKLETPGHRGMAFDAAGNLYVVNAKDNSIEKITAEGKDLGEFVGKGLKRPMEIAFDGAGNLYVEDSPESDDSTCVRKFSPAGKDLGVFATLKLENSRGFAIDHDGNLYAVSFWDGTVRKFSRQGKDLGAFVTDGVEGHAW